MNATIPVLGCRWNHQPGVANHEKRQEWEGKLKSGEVLCFNAALISPAADRERAEAAMINHHKPPCNTTYVNSFPFDGTMITTSGRKALLTDDEESGGVIENERGVTSPFGRPLPRPRALRRRKSCVEEKNNFGYAKTGSSSEPMASLGLFVLPLSI